MYWLGISTLWLTATASVSRRRQTLIAHRHRRAWIGTLLSALVIPVVFAADPTTTPLTPLLRERFFIMLRDVEKAIDSTYYDPAINAHTLADGAARAHARIASASRYDDALAAIAQFTLDLGDSHTRFWPPEQTVLPDYGWDMGMVGEACLVTRVHAGSDADHQQMRPGDRIVAINGLQPRRDTLRTLDYLFMDLRPQPGLHVELITPDGTARELDIAARARRRKRVLDITGHDDGDISYLINRTEEWLHENAVRFVEASPGILVVKIPTFELEPSEVSQILSRARSYPTVILDLRGNSGGWLTALKHLLGGLYENDVVLMDTQRRTGTQREIATGAGSTAYHGNVITLVDASSASASEVFVRTLQLTHRGIVIGDRTAGSVMLARSRGLFSGGGEVTMYYHVSVTVADVLMADGGRLEKVGVTPDLEVLPSPADLAAGDDPALSKALDIVGVAVSPAAAGQLAPRP